MSSAYTLKVNFGYPIVVFDTETGGLNADDIIEFSKDPSLNLAPGDHIGGTFIKPAAPILELGAIFLNPITLEEEEHFYALLGPEKGQTVDELFSKCDSRALEVNGLTGRKKEFETAEPGSKVLADFIKWANKKGKSWIPAGQNVRFDIDMINSACKRFGVDYEIWNSPQELRCFSSLYFALPDTPIVANYKLTTIAEALGLKTEGAHAALTDVRMTADCLRIMYSRFGL